MTRTVAPKDLGGRLERNLARTTPELPEYVRQFVKNRRSCRRHTVRPGDLAPDHPNVGATDLTLSPVNESDLLAQVEGCGLLVVNTLDLDQAASISASVPVFKCICAVARTWCWGWCCACYAGSSGGDPCKETRIKPLFSHPRSVCSSIPSIHSHDPQPKPLRRLCVWSMRRRFVR